MSDLDRLSDRIDVLEARLTFQDVTIETLNNTITAQWQKIDALTRQVVELREQLAGTHAADSEQEPPPHY